jgi:hypothetical protein
MMMAVALDQFPFPVIQVTPNRISYCHRLLAVGHLFSILRFSALHLLQVEHFTPAFFPEEIKCGLIDPAVQYMTVICNWLFGCVVCHLHLIISNDCLSLKFCLPSY